MLLNIQCNFVCCGGLFVLGGISPSLHEMYRFKFVKLVVASGGCDGEAAPSCFISPGGEVRAGLEGKPAPRQALFGVGEGRRRAGCLFQPYRLACVLCGVDAIQSC